MVKGKQKAEQNLKAFITWQATLSDDCFKQIVFHGLFRVNA
ncbi:MAG: hypothetical protein ACI9YH_002882 [Colwellia sp.]|jgi:hypothetical protein